MRWFRADKEGETSAEEIERQAHEELERAAAAHGPPRSTDDLGQDLEQRRLERRRERARKRSEAIG